MVSLKLIGAAIAATAVVGGGAIVTPQVMDALTLSCATLPAGGSWNTANASSDPGCTVNVPSGPYGPQVIEWVPGRDSAAPVTFVPQGPVTIGGNLTVKASGVHIAGQATGTVTDWRSRTYSITVADDLIVAGDSATQKPHNVTIEGIDADSLQTMTATNVIARDIDSGPIVQGAACDRPEPKIGANVDGEIAAGAPLNHTWERVVVHGQDISLAGGQAGCHTGGMFIVNGDGIAIRESVFTENVIYNIQVQNYVGAPARNVTIENSWFTCPVLAEWEAPQYTCNGQASIQFNAASTFPDWLIRFSSFALNESVFGNFEASFSNLRLVGNIGQKPGPDICGRAGVTFGFNAWIGGTCGSADVSVSNPFVSLVKGAYDLHLKAANDLVTPTTGDYAIPGDIDRQARSTPKDAGSDEFDGAPPPPPPPSFECSDGIDNDSDGVIDYPADPGCSDAQDTDETDPPPPPPPPTACADGIDNDGDGKIDLADLGCTDAADDDEIDPVPPPPPPPDPDRVIFCSEFVPNERASWQPGKVLAKWAAQNPGERDIWSAFADAICAGQSPSPPPLATLHGKTLVAVGKMAL